MGKGFLGGKKIKITQREKKRFDPNVKRVILKRKVGCKEKGE